ncbi:E3 ubiquitin-protein ligase FANCL isoform X2 [Jatropha curcas]|uniref:E3 ubiquitin-protein ligase FANCL isoform X2 n=1 Tax=Jatropha curcas TaxID=180498 RepID=UPI0009D70D6B|nr:E3 ubiquitin-protein ligase FANCL isoform X2 [Jatropha curcas]
MPNQMESTTVQNSCRDLAISSSFYRSIYSEIEEVGWAHLVNLARDLKFLSFRVIDKKGQVHILEVQLDITYPKCPPSVSADVPFIFNVKWSMNSRLKDLVQQFHAHLDKLQEFWSTLDDIDNSLCVVNLKQPSHAMSVRQIDIGNDCSIMLFISAKDPRSLPECRFLGPDTIVNNLRKLWQRNSKQWKKDRTFLENLASVLETQLPKPPNIHKNDLQFECGICYAECLPIDDEFGPRSGTRTDYMCDNSNCNRAYHSVCLRDWLRSITTTRQSFDVLFGNCPYCSEPVAVKINNTKIISLQRQICQIQSV